MDNDYSSENIFSLRVNEETGNQFPAISRLLYAFAVCMTILQLATICFTAYTYFEYREMVKTDPQGRGIDFYSPGLKSAIVFLALQSVALGIQLYFNVSFATALKAARIRQDEGSLARAIAYLRRGLVWLLAGTVLQIVHYVWSVYGVAWLATLR